MGGLAVVGGGCVVAGHSDRFAKLSAGRASSLRCASLERPLVHVTDINIPGSAAGNQSWKVMLGRWCSAGDAGDHSPILVPLKSSVQYGQFR